VKKKLKKCAARYPVLHVERRAAPVEIIKVLAAQLVEQGFLSRSRVSLLA
jgi:hypothetical protein